MFCGQMRRNLSFSVNHKHYISREQKQKENNTLPKVKHEVGSFMF